MDHFLLIVCILFLNGYLFNVASLDPPTGVEQCDIFKSGSTWAMIKWNAIENESYVVNSSSSSNNYTTSPANVTDLLPGNLNNCSIEAIDSDDNISSAFFFNVQTAPNSFNISNITNISMNCFNVNYDFESDDTSGITHIQLYSSLNSLNFNYSYEFKNLSGSILICNVNSGESYNVSGKAIFDNNGTITISCPSNSFLVQTLLSPPNSAAQVNINETGSTFFNILINASMTANISSYLINCGSVSNSSEPSISWNTSYFKNISIFNITGFSPASVYNCSAVTQKYGFGDSVPIFFLAQTAPDTLDTLELDAVGLNFFGVKIPTLQNSYITIEFNVRDLTSNSTEILSGNGKYFNYSAVSGRKYEISARLIFKYDEVQTFGKFDNWLQVFMPLTPIAANSIQVKSDLANEDQLFVSWDAWDTNLTDVLYELRCISASVEPCCNSSISDFRLANISTTNGSCSGLLPGVQYNVSIVVTKIGHNASEPSIAFGKTYPSVVMNPTVLSNSSTFIHLSWMKRNDSLVDFYQVFLTSSNFTFTNISKPEINITDLDAYTTYELQIQASSNGLLGRTLLVNVTTFEGLPSEPLEVEIKNATNSSVLLIWQPPAKRRGEILDYLVNYQDLSHGVNGSKGSHSSSQTSNNTQIYIEGLFTGTEYMFTVRARTKAGLGDYSEEVFGYTKADLPYAPTGLVFSAFQTNVSAFWQPPDYHVGVEFEYLLRVKFEEECVQLHIFQCSDCRVSRVNVTDIEFLRSQIRNQCSSVNITIHSKAFQAKMNMSTSVIDLDPGLNYNISVFAINLQGLGPALTRTVRTLDFIPSAPLNVSVHPSNESSLLVTWQQPAHPNGEILFYRITYFSDNNSSKFEEVSGNRTSAILFKLIPGVCYSVSVAASTTVGYGSDSNVVRQYTNDTEPNVPANLNYTSTKDSLNIYWSRPLANPISVSPFMYILTFHENQDDGRKCVSFVQFVCANCIFGQRDMSAEGEQRLAAKVASLNKTCDLGTTESFNSTITMLRIFGSLSPGKKFSCFIWAVNRWGVGANSSLIDIKTNDDLSSEPTKLRITANENAIAISWGKPDQPNGEILMYNVSYRVASNNTTNYVTLNANETQYRLTSFEACDDYDVTVSAVNSAGVGRSALDFVNSWNKKANDVTQVKITAVWSRNITVNWDFVSNSRCDVKFLIEIRNESDAVVSTLIANNPGSLNLSGLQPFTLYSAFVQVFVPKFFDAPQINGSFMRSTHSNRTLEAAPSQPTRFVCKQYKYSGLICSWGKPDTLNGILQRYILTVKSEGGQVSSNIDGNNDTSYQIMSSNKFKPPAELQAEITACTSICADILKLNGTALEPGPPSYLDNKSYKEINKKFIEDLNKNSRSFTTSIAVTLPPLNDLISDAQGPIKGRLLLVAVNSDNNRQLLEQQQSKITKTSTKLFKSWSYTNGGLTAPYEVHQASLSNYRRKKRSTSYSQSINLTIGSDNQCFSTDDFCNGRLKESCEYLVSLRIYTDGGYVTFGPAILNTDSTKVGLIVGIAVGILLLVVLVGLILFVMLRRTKSKPRSSSNPLPLDPIVKPPPLVENNGGKSSPLKPVTPPNVFPGGLRESLRRLSSRTRRQPDYPRDVPLSEFKDYVHLLQKDTGLLNERQFDLLARLTKEMEKRKKLTMIAAKAQDNLQKNRFTNILPFDHSRVRLSTEDDSVDSTNDASGELSSFYSGTDYINANYMMGHHSQREFIACQGPIQSTIDDMWRLILEQNVRCIVMLTQLRERERPKCERYWPDKVEDTVCYGQDGLSVKLFSESTLGSYTVRVLEVCIARERRKITQLHYLKWEDFKAPDLTELWEFLRDFRRHVPRDIDAPILVHCSAGVGRTGTFIALDWIVNSLRDGATTINVPNHILQMRTQRCYMVQNFRQLSFIYTFLNWYLEHEMMIGLESKGSSSCEENVYANVPSEKISGKDNDAYLREDRV